MPLIMPDYKKFSWVVFFLSFMGCQTTPKLQRIQGEALGTTYTILYADTHQNEAVPDSIDTVFLRMNQSMSTYWPNSLISKINRAEEIKTDTDFRNVFRAAKQVWKQTDGYFDPTVGALVNAYGFGPTNPIEEINNTAIDSLLALTGFSKVVLFEEGILKKEHNNIYLDFNAIAKGYAVDALAKMLKSLKYSHFLVEVGGELYASGINPQKQQPWRVAIDHPKQEEMRNYVATLTLKNRGLASSGNYRKFRTDTQGNKYVHTINPKTGKTVKSNVLSSSVLAPTTMLADAYATALMAMPFDNGKLLVESLAEVEALWVLAEKDSVRVVATEGFDFSRQ